MDASEQRTDSIRLPETTTRIVVLGDPHGDLIALDLALTKEQRPDTAILSAGDNIGYSDGKISSYMCQVLEEQGIPSVLGNHEAWSQEGRLFLPGPGGGAELTPAALAWIRALPYRIRIRADLLPAVAMSLVHTLPDWAYVDAESAGRLLDQEEARIVFTGHTHRPAVYALERGKAKAQVHRFNPTRKTPLCVRLAPETRYVVDAGSLARPAAAGKGRGMAASRGTYAELDLSAQVIRLHSIDKRPRMKELFERMVERPDAS